MAESVNINLMSNESYSDSWSLGCDIIIEEADTDIQEIRLRDINLIGDVYAGEVPVDINPKLANVMELDVNVTIDGVNPNIVESQIVTYENILKITDYTKETTNETGYASSARSAKVLYDLIKGIDRRVNLLETMEGDGSGEISEEKLKELIELYISDMFYWADEAHTIIGTPHTFFSESEISANGLYTGGDNPGEDDPDSDTGATTLEELTDVALLSPKDGDILYFNGEKWVNKELEIPADLEGYLKASDAEELYATKDALNELQTNISAELAEYIKSIDADKKYATKDALNALSERIDNLNVAENFFSLTEDGQSIYTEYNLFSTKEISANGLSLGIGETYLGEDKLGTIIEDGDTVTFSANAINSIYYRLAELEENGGGGGNVDVDLSDYYTKTEVDGLFTKDNIKSVLQISDWALKSSLAASDVPNLPWSKITTGKPTALSDFSNDMEFITRTWAVGTFVTEYWLSNNYASLDWIGRQGFITESDLDDYGFLTGITKSMVTSALGYTPFNSASFTKANIQSKLGISDWALASSKPSYSYSEINGAPDSLSDLTDDILNGYYLKLAGGTITGNLTVNGYTKIGSATLAWKSSALEVNKPFYSTGEISANGLYTSSDMRFKYKIEDISLDLDTIANAPMFRFIWNNNDDESIHIGSSAQYWKEHARELVSIDDKDFHRLDYSTLGVLMGKSLATEVKELKKAVEEINRRMEYGN